MPAGQSPTDRALAERHIGQGPGPQCSKCAKGGRRAAHTFSLREMLPAVGQGIVAVECAENDWTSRRQLEGIDDAAARHCAEAEREVLWILNGHCNSPIAGHATIRGETMTLIAAVIDAEGDTIIEVERKGPVATPRELGRAVGLELLDKGAAAIIEKSRPAE